MESTWLAGATAPSRDPVIHALKRFTYGPTPELVDEVRRIGVDAWFENQLNYSSVPDQKLDEFLAKWKMFDFVHKDVNLYWKLAEDESLQPLSSLFSSDRMSIKILHLYTVISQAHSNRQIYEMMVEFWHDHFNITSVGEGLKDELLDWHTNDWNKNVIRAHALGNFEDMLNASAIHPAMIVYLDGELSAKQIPNENYSRELLELHTVTPKSGYTQDDVISASKLFSGLRVKWPTRYYARRKDFNIVGEKTLIDVPPFQTMLHVERQNFGTFKIMGWEGSVNSASQVLPAIKSLNSYLVSHPQTAKTIALKLGRRFVRDEPSDKFINDIASVFTSSKGDIQSTLRAVLRHPDFSKSVGTKFKRPGEDYISVARALKVWPNFSNLGVLKGRTQDFPVESRIVSGELTQLGHAPLSWPFPDGYADVASAWVNSNAQLVRWNIYSNFVRGTTWNQPAWQEIYTPDASESVDSLIDRISQSLLFSELGRSDRTAISNAIAKTYGISPDLQRLRREIIALIARLVIQLPVWSLR